ncbi:MAG: hypothetical protein GY854_30155 [Deltaproteobacteria bacterium]|nr:hypothetical protein [Deltaproteobacteria bacterium]
MDQIHEAEAVVLAVYTDNYDPNTPTEYAYSNISQFFEPDYVTGQLPPFQSNFSPFSAIIDLETMEPMMREGIFNQLTPQRILNLLEEAANN